MVVTNAGFKVAAVVIIVGLAACDLMVEGLPEGRFDASLTAESRIGTGTSDAVDYVGTGFYDMHLTPTDLDAVKLYSAGTGGSSGDRVVLAIVQRGWPRAGEYVIDMNPQEAAEAERPGTAGQYWITRPDGVQQIYWAHNGLLVISEVHERYMEGSFTITGVLYCTIRQPPAPRYEGPCTAYPVVVPDSSPTTRFAGTFVVTKQEEP